MPLLSFPDKIHHKQYWSQLFGSALHLGLAEFCQQQTGIKLIVTADHLSAQQLVEDLTFFLAQTSGPAPEILRFPDWETLPYDQFSPHQDIISERLYTLSRMQQAPHLIVVSTISTLMHRLSPPSFLSHFALLLQEGQTLHIDSFREQLQRAGYYVVNKVLEHGEYAVRGSIFDLYPMGSRLPLRIELFDDTIESLRYFDPDTQRTIEKISQVQILPAREFPLNDDSITLFRRAFREKFTGNPGQCPIYEAVSAHQFSAGIEYYLPLFFTETATIFDYMPPATTICLVECTYEHAEKFWQDIQTRYEQRNYDVTRPILPPTTVFLTPNDYFTGVNQYQTIYWSQETRDKKGHDHQFNTAKPAEFPVERAATEPLNKLIEALSQSTHRTLIVVESAGRREVLLELLKKVEIKVQPSWQAFLQDQAPIQMTVGSLQAGAEFIDAGLSIIVENQLFGQQHVTVRERRHKAVDPNLIIRDLAELQMGAPVVHLEFGVGRYQGLQTIETQQCQNDYLVLSYAGDDKIYVPVTALNMISRYTGSDHDHAPLHRLGTDKWQRDKKKAAEKIHDVAIELLEIYAKREAQPGMTYHVDLTEYQRFASGFPFTETIDQQQAIQAIMQDLQSTRPMDRLICGDVGFGKTEVAMRAAFLAVQNSKQVCLLVPTTLLAAQHFETFRDRFADFPIHIELLSRFRSAKEAQTVIHGMKEGRVDIVIGTHKLFQKDIAFHNLGLLIIDEEHRFGVKQKEYIKALRTHVDILSMTATPIPRTLNMAMHGIRDISLIATPPAKRLAIKTFWQEKNDTLVREALLREILRGGQVFYLHNNVQTIERVTQDIQTLVPEAKVQFAHGQMRERELERIMSDFYHHRFNVLVCTTIIETGIDIPTANTIIIDKADQFGLAQLHQLRGRVGRSHHQAYAYLFTPHEKSLTADAIKRLKALVSLEDLGVGFTLATHDLEIRGAGELLGEDQSGNMHAVGFTLYMDMLDKAVHDLKAGITPALAAPIQRGPDIELQVSTIIPEDYINDIHLRLIFYKRIANATSKEDLHELQIELIDRFGLLPSSVKHLFLMTQLKRLAEKIGVTKIMGNEQQANIDFNENPAIDAQQLIQCIQLHSAYYKMAGPTRLQVKLKNPTPEGRIHEISELLSKLAQQK